MFYNREDWQFDDVVPKLFQEGVHWSQVVIHNPPSLFYESQRFQQIWTIFDPTHEAYNLEDKFNRTHYRNYIRRLVCDIVHHFTIFWACFVSRNDILRNALELLFGKGNDTLQEVSSFNNASYSSTYIFFIEVFLLCRQIVEDQPKTMRDVHWIPSRLGRVPSWEWSVQFSFPLARQDQHGCHLRSEDRIPIRLYWASKINLFTILSTKRCCSGDNLSHWPEASAFSLAAFLALKTSRRMEDSTPKSRRRDSASLEASRSSFVGDTLR